jgi:hypothetical protein
MENPPQRSNKISLPINGIDANKLVITIAPQKLICPHGKT